MSIQRHDFQQDQQEQQNLQHQQNQQNLQHQQNQQNLQNQQINDNLQGHQAGVVNRAANLPQVQQQHANNEVNIIQELGLQQEQVIQAAPNQDLAIKEEIRQAHLALHRKQADGKKQNDKKKAYDRKVKLRDPSKKLLTRREENFETITRHTANYMGVAPETLLEDPGNKKIAKVAYSMTVLLGDNIERSVPLIKTLQLDLDGASDAQIIDKRHELERIFSVFLELDMTSLDFEKAEDLTKEDMKEKLAIIDLCPKIEDFIIEYQQLMHMNVGCLVTERMLHEIQARNAVVEKYGEAYRERLKLMSNKYYALLLQEDTADASTQKLREKYAAAVAANNQELKEYLEMILNKRKAKKDGTYKAAKSGDKALDLLKIERGKLGLKGDEGLEAPGMDRINAQAHGLAEQITPERFRRVLNSKRREKKEELAGFVTQIRQTEDLPNDVQELLNRLDEYNRIHVCACDGGQRRNKRMKEAGGINKKKIFTYALSLVFRQSKTGQNVRDERHRIRIIIEDIGKALEKYRGKDQQRYGHVVQALTRLNERLIKETGTPPTPLTEDQKKAEYQRRGWTRRQGQYTDLNLVGRKRDIIEDDDTKGAERFLIERDFEVDARKSVLFAHEPCIEDISQGAMGDCFFLAGLVSVMQRDPGVIRDMMMDNGDGSVTVRFYDQINGLRPIYITVDKKVRLTGATHTVWVQVMEKAFTAYLQHKEMNELKIRRGSNVVRPYPFDHNKIEYGFISKGGKSHEVVEALTGLRGIDRAIDKGYKLRAYDSEDTDGVKCMTALIRESYNRSWSEIRLRDLRNKEFEHDKSMLKNAERYLEMTYQIPEEYEEFKNRIREAEEKMKSPDAKVREEAQREKTQAQEDFKREYILRHSEERDNAPVVKEIASLEERIPDNNNILQKNGNLIFSVENREEPPSGLYLDREVDEELNRLAGERISDEKTRNRIRRKLAEISEKDAAKYLMSYTKQLPPELRRGLPGTHEAVFKVDESSLAALIHLVGHGYEDAEIFYTQHYSFENNKDVSELAKSIGLDPDQVRELVIKNRKKIVENLCANATFLKTLSDPGEDVGREGAYTYLEKHYYESIEDAIKRNAYVNAGTEGDSDQHYDAGGICNNHAYSVLGVFDDEKTGKKYVIVRDPHGGAGTVFKKDRAGNKVMSVSEEDTYGVNQLELKYFLSKFRSIYING